MPYEFVCTAEQIFEHDPEMNYHWNNWCRYWEQVPAALITVILDWTRNIEIWQVSFSSRSWTGS